jgi:hypothetical protein
MSFLFKAIGSVVKAVVGIVSKVVGGVFGFLVGGKSKSTAAKSSIGRLNKTLNPEDFRKIVFGKTASALDLRYWEVYGTSGVSYDEVIAMACHQINAVKELYIEDALAIDASNTTQTNYSGVLTRTSKLGAPAQTALSVGAGGQWTVAATMTGVAHMVLKWTKNDTKLPNGPPSRYTNIIEGALVYDPRRDSTVPGGSGTHRINDQTTWNYATTDSNGVPIGRNNALQALWYLIGWRVQNPTTSEMVLVAGRGLDVNDINIQSFITGANNCETAGFYTDMILSTEDEHTSNEDKITADGLIAQLIDPGGLWSYYANVDDTATVAVYLTDNDILDTGKVSWNEYKPMSEQFNQVVGKFIDPSATALFQPRAYPMVRDATYETNLGVKRRKSIDFEQIQDALLAQKLARLSLNQGQYQAEFGANFSYRAIKAQAWSIVSYTSERFGWTKLFRVYRQSIGPQGIGMTLREVNASIWTPGSVVTPPAVPLGLKYDPTQTVALAGLTGTALSGTGADGTIQDGCTVTWTAPPASVKRTELQIKLVAGSNWQSFGPFDNDVTAVNLFPMLSQTVYMVRARHVTVHEVAGAWTNLSPNFTVGNTSNVQANQIITSVGTAAAIVGQGTLATQNSATWSTQVTGTGKPEDNSTLADNRISNSNMADNTRNQWWGSLTRTAGVAANNDPAFFARTTTGIGDGGYINGAVRAPCVAGERMYGSVLGRAHTPASNNTIRFNPFFYKADGTFLSQQVKSVVPTASTFGALKTYFDVPAGAATFECIVSALCNGGSYTDCAMPRLGYTEYLADVTVGVELAADKTVAADYLGAVTSDNLALLIWSPKITKAGLSVKGLDNVSYALANTYGGTFAVDTTNGSSSKGDITTSALTAINAGGDLIITIDGLDQPKVPFKVTKILADAPITGGSGNKLKTWDSGEMVGLNTVSYTTIFTAVKTVTLASGETLYGSAPLDYYVSGTTNASRTMSMKWQYSVAGAGSWNDFAAAITGSTATSGRTTGPPDYEYIDPVPGSIAVTQSKSGLGAGDYDIRIVAICSTTGRIVTPSGTATIEAKV